MAIARVQFKNGTGEFVTSVAATFTSNITAGNFIVVLISNFYGENPFPSTTVTDTLGNTYTQDLFINNATTDSANARAQLVYHAQSASGGANTVTVGNLVQADSYPVITVIEYSGIATSSPVDVSNKFRYNYANHGYVNTTTYSSHSVTTTSAAALLVGAAAEHATTDIYTLDSGWTKITVPANSFNDHAAVEQIVSSTGTYTNSGSIPSTTGVSATLIAFKGAGGAAFIAQKGLTVLQAVNRASTY